MKTTQILSILFLLVVFMAATAYGQEQLTLPYSNTDSSSGNSFYILNDGAGKAITGATSSGGMGLYGHAYNAGTAIYGYAQTGASYSIHAVANDGAHGVRAWMLGGNGYGLFTSLEPAASGVGLMVYQQGTGRGGIINLTNASTTSDALQIYNSGTGWSGYFGGGKGVHIEEDLAIGTIDTQGYRLAINGKAVMEELKVELAENWPDYVFLDDYELPSLADIERYIQENGHLPVVSRYCCNFVAE